MYMQIYTSNTYKYRYAYIYIYMYVCMYVTLKHIYVHTLHNVKLEYSI